MPIADSFIDDLVNRTDITQLVSEYVKLTKRSGNNEFGLCPFHSEKTPSFSVNSDKQIYYCFGCGKGGGAINFMMEIENFQFMDAIEAMAKRIGLKVPDESAAAGQNAAKRQRMLQLNADAARHFHSMLSSPQGAAVSNYLASRKISKGMVTRFGIGAAPDSWTLLIDAMEEKGYSKQELIEAGLARSGQRDGTYDVFRNRLMFPVIDVRGGVIGFSGRIVGDGEPKYLNSPETLVFIKSRNLFGLNIARKSKAGTLILAEGNIDVVTLHQYGFDGAVASLGTALTADQARLMSRYADRVVIAYDSDEAGKRATLRAIPLLENAGMAIKVLDMGDSKDPDDYLRRFSADAFSLLLERSDNHIEYRLNTIEKNHDLTQDEGRLAYISSAVDLLAELSSKPEREIYSARAAMAVGISPQSIEYEVENKVRQKQASNRKEQNRRSISVGTSRNATPIINRNKTQRSTVAEEELIRALTMDSTYFSITQELGFTEEEFTSEFLAKIFSIISRRVSEDKDTRESLILSELDNNEAIEFSMLYRNMQNIPYSSQSIRDFIGRIREDRLRTIAPDNDFLLELKTRLETKNSGG
ncbi:MAG: DNA primase [Oscillospiraceae bacterium]|nr:DNA primase [Oscillospiraceae bacterium]